MTDDARAPDRPVDFFRHDLGPAELGALRRTLDGVFLATGPRVAEFEAAFAALLGVPHVVGTSSCTLSLTILLRALGVGPGDEVVTSPMTYVATCNAILHAGARVVFADIDPATGLLDPAAAEAAVTPRTKAIVAVHLYGQLAPMPALRAVADRHGLKLIEDAAHAVLAARDGVGTGRLGDGAVFSFYATKELTSGDGGAVAVHDSAVADRLRRLRNQGVSTDAHARHGGAYRHWDVTELGYKAAMTDLDAALLLAQLPRIEAKRAAREAVVDRYRAGLAGRPDVAFVRTTGRSSHHLAPILVPAAARDAVLAGLGRRRIGCTVNYRAVHTLTYYRDLLGHAPADFPHAAAFGDRVLSLPLWAGLPADDVDRVVHAVCEALDEAG